MSPNTIWINVEKYNNTSSIISALSKEVNIPTLNITTQEIATYLDQIHACIVFDGIEQIGDSQIDSLEDFLTELDLLTHQTQITITSQINLVCFKPDKEIRVLKLTSEESCELFNLSSIETFDSPESNLLIKFCEGHPLAIKISTSIIRFYGSPTNALKAIKAKSFITPARSKLDKYTSLEICLSIAYEALNPDALKLLWALSELPSGIFKSFIESGFVKVNSIDEALAYLYHWNLIEPIYKLESIERIGMLSPIRQFVRNKTNADNHHKELEQTITELSEFYCIWIAVIEKKFSAPEDLRGYLDRLEHEIDNLLNLMSVICKKFDNRQLVETANNLGMTLMKYFFVSNEVAQGSLMLSDLISLSINTKIYNGLTTLLAQFITLATRTKDIDLIAKGKEFINIVEPLLDTSTNYPELYLAKAMAEEDSKMVESYALQACKSYQLEIAKEGHDPKLLNDLHNGISDALCILGSSLLGQSKFIEARNAYSQSLTLCNGAHIALNRGQALHQLGNCESCLENDASAIELYAEAAEIFEDVGMAEYISNSISEIGFCYLKVDKIELNSKLTKAILEFALNDTYQELEACFKQNKQVDHDYSGKLIRKLAGVHYVFTLTGASDRLEGVFDKLFNQQLIPLINRLENNALREKSNFSISDLHFVLVSGLLAAKAEKELCIDDKVSIETISQLFNLFVEFPASVWLREVTHIYDWLYLFLTQNLKIDTSIADRLIEFIQNNDDGWVHDEIDLNELFSN